MEKKTMDFKEIKKCYMEEIGRKKGKVKIMLFYNNLKTAKKNNI